jgi:hypothetical protein
MRESRTFGSVGGEGGNVLAYPAISCRSKLSGRAGLNSATRRSCKSTALRQSARACYNDI